MQEKSFCVYMYKRVTFLIQKIWMGLWLPKVADGIYQKPSKIKTIFDVKCFLCNDKKLATQVTIFKWLSFLQTCDKQTFLHKLPKHTLEWGSTTHHENHVLGFPEGFVLLYLKQCPSLPWSLRGQGFCTLLMGSGLTLGFGFSTARSYAPVSWFIWYLLKVSQ